MTTNKFTATLDTIGEWDGAEAEAVACWNRAVAPELGRCYARLADETGNDGAPYFEVASQAWELFCETRDEECVAELGARVADWVRAQS